MSMKMKIQLTIETESGEMITSQEVAALERTDLQAETLGLTLAEAKTVLHKLQEVIVAQQVADYTAGQRRCPTCHHAVDKPYPGMSRLYRGRAPVQVFPASRD